MLLTGKRLIVLIALFIGACFVISARQAGDNAKQGAQNGTPSAKLASATPGAAPQKTPAKAPSAARENTVAKPAVKAASASLEGVSQKAPAKVESVVVNPVPQTRPEVPLNGNIGGSQSSAGIVKSADGKDVVGVPVNEKNGGAGNNVSPKAAGLDQKAGKADDRGSGTRTAKADVQREHRPLAEADKSKSTVVEAKRRKTAVKKSIQQRRRALRPAPKLARVAKRKVEPLTSAKWISPTAFWRVW